MGDTEEDRVARAFNKATSSIQRHALLSFKTCTPLLCLAEREMSLRLFSFLCVCVCVWLKEGWHQYNFRSVWLVVFGVGEGNGVCVCV